MPYRMILRLSKEEPVRFLSHLDVQAMLQRALRRSGLPAAYTQGFHPHAQISFPLALGLGFTSDGEYADVQLSDEAPADECASRLADVLPDGFGVRALCVLRGCPKLSVLMRASDYRIVSGDGRTLTSGMRTLTESASVTARKRGKGGEKSVDIRPMVLSWVPDGEGVAVRLRADADGALSPALLVRTLWEHAGLPADTPFSARRLDLLTAAGKSLFECVRDNEDKI